MYLHLQAVSLCRSVNIVKRADNSLTASFSAVWNLLVGPKELFSMEQRLYHSVALLFLPVLAVFTVVNIQMELWPSMWISILTAIVEAALFSLSRWGGAFRLSTILNGILSYITLSLNYIYNDGLDGPTIILFILTILVLMTATPRGWRYIWAAMHLVVVGSLLWLELTRTGGFTVIDTYASRQARYADHFITFCILVFTLNFLTSYILRQYREQRSLAAAQEEIIINESKDLMRSEGQLQAFFQNAADCHILLDEQYRILTYNREASALFRRTRSFNLHPGAELFVSMPSGDAHQLEIICSDALISGSVRHLELAVSQASGGVSWWRFSAAPAQLADGSRLGVVLSAISIQERVQQEAQIRAQAATLVQIANLHAHALRGPAASILGLVKLVRELGYKATEEDLELLQEAAETLDARIHEIVALTGEQRRSAEPLPGVLLAENPSHRAA